ncbi:hypothetical protein [Xenorhabdus nematophila]|nr:hypothetical protein [Xenorhabdus nematophila]
MGQPVAQGAAADGPPALVIQFTGPDAQPQTFCIDRTFPPI